MLAVAVVFNGIQFAERIFGLNMPSSQFIAHEQQDVDSRGSVTTPNAGPIVAVQGDKPFRRPPPNRATGARACVVSTASGSNDTHRSYQRWRAGTSRPAFWRHAHGACGHTAKGQSGSEGSNADVAEAGSPAKQKPVMTASVRPPPANPVRAAPPAAPASMKAMGSTLSCCRRTKRRARHRKSSPTCRRSMLEFSARNSPRSRSSAVKPARGTASWQRLPRRRRRRPTRSATTCVRPAMAAAGSRRTEAMHLRLLFV